MGHHLGRVSVIVIAASLLATAIGTSPASSSAAGAGRDDAAGWQKLWHPAFAPKLGAGVEIRGVQRIGDRFAITGGDDRGAVVWWSDDGLQWTRTWRSEALDRGSVTSIAGGPDSFVMIGDQTAPTWRGRIWHSADGRRWEPAASKLPRGSEVGSVALTDGGDFVVYGSGIEDDQGCFMGSSDDGGASWDLRWVGDWDPGVPGACLTSVSRDGPLLVGRRNLGAIVESSDGITWQEVVGWEAIKGAFPRGEGRRHDVGLVPLGDGRFVLGGRDSTTLTWSRSSGLGLVDELIGWKAVPGRAALAIGPERAVAVKRYMPAPLVSPAPGMHTEPWPRRQPNCRPGSPQVSHIAAMQAYARLECYGARELTFEAWIPHMEYGGTCPFGPPYGWMECTDYWLASGPGPRPAFLVYGLAPDARLDRGLDPASSGTRVRVTGHFDDPAAARCPEPGWNGRMPGGWEPMTRADFVAECRQRFIVTEMRRIRD